MSFNRDIIVLISSPILFVSTSFLVNIGKEMSLPGFRPFGISHFLSCQHSFRQNEYVWCIYYEVLCVAPYFITVS